MFWLYDTQLETALLSFKSIPPPLSPFRLLSRFSSLHPSIVPSVPSSTQFFFVHRRQTFVFLLVADAHGKYPCLTDNNCPHYSKCVENRCTCRFELIGDGEKCKACKYSRSLLDAYITSYKKNGHLPACLCFSFVC